VGSRCEHGQCSQSQGVVDLAVTQCRRHDRATLARVTATAHSRIGGRGRLAPQLAVVA